MGCTRISDPRLVGDPVDVVKGAAIDETIDFRLVGPLDLRWVRHYDSSLARQRLALGWGHTHAFDLSLRFDADGFCLRAPIGRAVGFPPLLRDGDVAARDGFALRRISLLQYELRRHGEPSVAFQFPDPSIPARPVRLFSRDGEIRFTYSKDGLWERIVDSMGRIILVREKPDGRIQSLSLDCGPDKPAIPLLVYEYDDQGNLISTIDSSGHGFRCVYDSANRLIRRVGRKGFSFCFTYDAGGRCVKSTGEGRMHEVSLEYDPSGRITKVTRADGGGWTYIFSERGQLTRIIDPLGGIQAFVLDEAGRVSEEVDPNGNATRIVYDRAGAAAAKIDVFGGRVALPEDPNAPDPRRHRVAANPAEFEYGRLLDVNRITLPNAEYVESLPFPTETRSLVVTAPERSTPTETSFQPHPLGVNWRPKPKQGRFFNDLGKLIWQGNAWGQKRRWSYDASGNPCRYQDFDGGVWSYDLGNWHLRLAETNPLGASVRFGYNAAGEIASCVDAGGTLSEYSYNLRDQLIEVRRHGVTRDRYVRDLAGNLIAKYARDGRLLLQLEIGRGNLPVKRVLASGDEHTFEYDPTGRYVVAATRSDRLEFAYDALGNRCLEKRNGCGAEHRFAGWRLPAESVMFGRFRVQYERRRAGALAIIDPGGARQELRFDPQGLTERRFSNGSSEFSQYDCNGRCLFKHVLSRGVGSWSRRFYWSGEGELSVVADNRYGIIRHEYDAAHRLRRRILPGKPAEEYVSDPADNLLRQPELDALASDGNRLHSANGFAIGYNDRNHIEARATPEGFVRYTYDSRDQLVLICGPRLDWRAEYDGLGRRCRKIVGGQVTEYFWNTDQLIAEIQPDGRLRIYIYSDPLALTPLLFLDYDSLEAQPDSCQRYFVFADQIGTPCRVEDISGATVWQARIDPYGRAHIAPDARIECHLRFPGHYFDAETGLHYNRFRYYDPGLGRYLQSDPWGIAGGYNLYAYRTNPLLHVDVRGLGEEDDTKAPPVEEDEEGTSSGGPEDDDEWRPKSRQEPEDPPRYDGQTADLSSDKQQWDAEHGVTILSDQERDQYRVVSNDDGQLVWNKDGEPVDTGDHPGIYVMDQDGNIYMHPDPAFGEIHHSTLAAGQPVAGAGEMQVINGQPVQVDDRSGHYGGSLPDGSPGRVTNEMNSQGVNTTNTETEEVQS
jgi:RHS repeat-associated protein